MDYLTVDQWVQLFKEIGLDNDTMTKWHRLFEKQYPQAHQAFLEWLHLSEERINKIRAK